MKVLVITHKNPYPPNDGGSMAMFTMINGLLLNNCDVNVLAMNPLKLFKPIDKQCIPTNINFQAIPVNTNVSIVGAIKNLFSSHSYFVSRFLSKEFEQVLIKKLQEKNYDIVQFESIFPAVYIDTVRQYSNAKIILSAHNIEYQIWNRVIDVEKSYIKKLYFTIQKNRLRKFEESIFRKSDGITAITELDKKEIQDIVPEKSIVVTPNGLNMRHYTLLPFESQKISTIFFIGSLDWIPNQQGIVWFLDNVWPLVIQRAPDIQLIIAGKNIPQWLMDRKEKNVTYQPNLPDVKPLFQNHAIMISPILSGSGIRVKIIEGLAFGKCIISTTIGAEGIPCTHQKDIIIADTPYDFATAILELVRNIEKVKQIQINARNLAEQCYDREKVYLPLVGLYHQLKNV